MAALIRAEQDAGEAAEKGERRCTLTTQTIDAPTVAAVGSACTCWRALAKALFRTPQRQAQIDAIERKVDAVLGEVQGSLK